MKTILKGLLEGIIASGVLLGIFMIVEYVLLKNDITLSDSLITLMFYTALCLIIGITYGYYLGVKSKNK